MKSKAMVWEIGVILGWSKWMPIGMFKSNWEVSSSLLMKSM
ncbi:hypothetical protein NST38_31210 [Paenibacillus sp. FSL H8-0104]